MEKRIRSPLVIALSVPTISSLAGFAILRSHQLSLVDPYNNPYTTYSTACLDAFLLLWLCTLITSIAMRRALDAMSTAFSWTALVSGGLVIGKIILVIVSF